MAESSSAKFAKFDERKASEDLKLQKNPVAVQTSIDFCEHIYLHKKIVNLKSLLSELSDEYLQMQNFSK